MPCDKSALLEFLEVLNEDLTRKITLVAAGGTAITLLDLKPSTIDIDFTIPSSDLPEFERASQTKRQMADVHAAVFSPLNINLPTLVLLQVRSAKIANEILRLNLENRFSLSQAFASASASCKK